MQNMDWQILFLDCIIGAGLGFVYFAGLWYTVRRLPTVRAPAFWMVGSAFLRLAILLFGFYFFIALHWPNLLAAVAGVLLMRQIMVSRISPARQSKQKLTIEHGEGNSP